MSIGVKSSFLEPDSVARWSLVNGTVYPGLRLPPLEIAVAS
jgi:hypothetical protein